MLDEFNWFLKTLSAKVNAFDFGAEKRRGFLLKTERLFEGL